MHASMRLTRANINTQTMRKLALDFAEHVQNREDEHACESPSMVGSVEALCTGLHAKFCVQMFGFAFNIARAIGQCPMTMTLQFGT